MKKFSILTAAALLIFNANNFFAQQPMPLAFYKGCLVTSITRGPSKAIYTTASDYKKQSHEEVLRGKIDPLIMEYGITDKIGVGFSLGGENYDVNVNDFYGAKLPSDKEVMTSSTKYLTADVSYHPLVTKKLDVSVFGAMGSYKVSGSIYQYDNCGYAGKNLFRYNGKGAVARAGIRTRLYLTKRLGVMAMAYAFGGMVNEKAKTADISDGIKPARYSTTLKGMGMEFGVSYRFFKQKGLKQEIAKPKKSEKEESDDEDKKEPMIRLVWD